MPDGKITIKTDIDASGAKKKLNDLKKEAQNSLQNGVETPAKSAQKSVDAVGESASKTAKNLDSSSSALKKVSSTSSEAGTSVSSLDKYFSQLDAIAEDTDKQLNDLAKVSGQTASANKTLSNDTKNVAKSMASSSKEVSSLANNQKKQKDTTLSVSEVFTQHRKKLEDLKKQYAETIIIYGKNSKEAKSLGREISTLSSQVAKEANATEVAKKEADKMDRSIVKLGNDSEKSGNKVGKFGNIASTALKGSVAVIKGVGAGIGVASTAVGVLVKKSVDAYSSYEQLVGGVNTIFGTGDKSLEEYAKSVGKTTNEVKDKYDSLMSAQETVMKNAAKAYNTAGLSANAYMEQITGFSASLVQSLGGDTEKAAEVGNRAIIDMSDNANKMGTGMEMIQNAYQGFAKQNYTMLDNLKLGYGGTKEEMKRLISDASEMTDIQEKLNVSVEDGSLDFGNIINAISVMQASLGIAGTTHEEAARTIEGSTNAMKASWDNLLVGIADDQADFDELVNQFVTSVDTWAKNIMPRIEIALQGASNLIASLLPMIAGKIPELLNEVAPQLIQAGTDIITGLISGFIQGLPDIIQTIKDLIPQILEAFYDILPQMNELFQTILPQILDLLVYWIPQIIEFEAELIQTIVQGLIDAFPEVINSVVTLINQLTEYINSDGLTQLIDLLLQIINQIITVLTEQTPVLLDAATNLLMAIVDALPEVIQKLLLALPKLVTSITKFFSSNAIKIYKIFLKVMLELVKAIPEVIAALVVSLPDIIKAIIEGLISIPETLWSEILKPGIEKFINFAVEAKDKAKDAAKGFFTNLIDGIKSLPGKIKDKALEIVNKLADFKRDFPEKAKEAATEFFNNLWNGLKDLPSKIWDIGKNIVEGIWNGINDKFDWLTGKIKEFTNGVKDKLKSFFGIHSPSTVMRDEVGKYISLGIAEGISKNSKAVTDQVTKLGESVLTTLKKVMPEAEFKAQGSKLVKELTSGINSKITKFKESMDTLTDSYTSALDELKSSREKMARSLLDWGDLYKKDEKENIIISAKDLQKQTKDINKYEKNLVKLKSSISEDLINEITSMGVEEGYAFTQALLKLDNKQLEEYDKSFLKKKKASERVANAWYKKDIDDLKSNYTTKVSGLMSNLVSDITKSGQDAINGFMKSFKGTAVEDAIKKFCDNVTSTLKKNFKIDESINIASKLKKAQEKTQQKKNTKKKLSQVKASQVSTSSADQMHSVIKDTTGSIARSLAASYSSSIDYDQIGDATASGIKKAGISVNIDSRKAGRLLGTVNSSSIIGGFA